MRASALTLTALTAALALATPLQAPRAQTTPLPAAPAPVADPADAERQRIEAVLRDLLAREPELVVNALQKWQEKETASRDNAVKTVVRDRRAELINDPGSPVAGNPQGNVTVVEFFDYQCGYCKMVAQDLARAIKEDPNLKVVFKELPILGDGSDLAAKAALALNKQGKYYAFHQAMMAHKGKISQQAIDQVAQSVGADIARMKSDMNAPDVTAQIAATLELARALNIRGTPAFVIGDEVLPGAIELNDLKAKVAAGRKG